MEGAHRPLTALALGEGVSRALTVASFGIGAQANREVGVLREIARNLAKKEIARILPICAYTAEALDILPVLKGRDSC
jgi:DNA-binding NarL/FixJ family response regulator